MGRVPRLSGIPVIVITTIAIVLPGCSKRGSDRGSVTVPQTAVYIDANANGVIDPGDRVTVTFSTAVGFPLPTAADAVFELSGGTGPSLGSSTLSVGASAREVVIDLVGATLQPNGRYGADPASTGIDLRSAQTALTYGAGGKPVPPLGTPLDIGGELAPRILGARFTDMNPDCIVGAGDTVEVSFTTAVDLLGPPDQAFQVLPAAPDPFGTAPGYVGGTTGVLQVTILLGASPSIDPIGPFDPISPGGPGDPSGIDVQPASGLIVDAAYPTIDAAPYLVPGVDLQGEVIRVDRSTYTDLNGNGSLDAGDTLFIEFCASVDIDPSATPETAFQLPVSGDTFGVGASFNPPPGAAVIAATIVLGARPRLNPNGAYDPANLLPSSPSGLDFSAAGLIYHAGKTFPVPPSSPPGVDLGGTQNLGLWWTGTPMAAARYAHTATLLPNGEILIVGGMHDVESSVNLGFRETLSSIEVFDPVSGTFTTASGSLVRPRGYHKAVRTPGPDGVPDTPDDYVVIVGGWNSEVFENGGPHSEGSVEVIRPDWNGDGQTDDLVVNPTPSGTPAGVVPGEIGQATFGGISSACADATVRFGIQDFDIQWVPGFHVGGAGDNELLVLGNFFTHQWNDCTGALSLWQITYSVGPPDCWDGRVWIGVDRDNDGDLFDNAPDPDGLEIAGITMGAPWTSPVSLIRVYYTQTRLAGPDGIDGTADDVQVIYGGLGHDFTSRCLMGASPGCRLADLETFDLASAGRVYTGVSDAYTTCGLWCSAPGSGGTDRDSHVAVPLGGAQQQIALVGGYHSSMAGVACTRAVEIVTIDFVDPTLSTIAYGGQDVIDFRVRNLGAGLLEGSGNVIATGGIDWARPGTTATGRYYHIALGRDEPVRDLTDRRDAFAFVSIPAGYAGLPLAEDRFYVFGGLQRDIDAGFVFEDDVTFPGATLSSVEYFTEY